MRTFRILLAKELRSFFLSPIAYVVLALVMLLNGIAFYASVRILQGPPSEGSLVTWTFNSPWFYLSYFTIFPLITMRLFSEEQKLGTIETLLTAPVRTTEMIFSKYVAAVIFYCVLWLPSLLNFYVFQWITRGMAEIPPGQLLGSYTIVLIMGLFNIALGCFASSLTKNQIVSAILSFTMILLHFLLGAFMLYLSDQHNQQYAEFTSYFASIMHIKSFTSGLIDTRPLIYYLSFTALILSLTHQVLDFRRWKV
ncbi:MAG: ABC-2 type transport system permease protein [Verrucomicrobiales bacterium]|jgi:ABC-2 type transport system permease protein